MWDFLLIDLQDVVATKERSYFPETDLHNLANLIVAMKGLMRPVPLELRMSNLEKRLETQLQAIREEYQKEIKRLEEKIIISPPPSASPPPSPPSKSILELLNSCDANQLKKAGIPPASVNEFLKKRSEKPFDSVEDIQRGVTGIGQVRLAKLVDYLLTSN